MRKMLLRMLLRKFVPDSAIVIIGLLLGVPITFPTEAGYLTIRILSGEGRYCEPWMAIPQDAPKFGSVPCRQDEYGQWVRWTEFPNLTILDMLNGTATLSQEDIEWILHQL